MKGVSHAPALGLRSASVCAVSSPSATVAHVFRVLIAEDDRAARSALHRALRLNGYEVFSVDNGDDALAQHRTAPFDLLLLDWAMPRKDGVEVCRELRRAGDKTPILILTARTSSSERVEGLDAGADDYQTKPYDLDELLARMRAMLRRVEQPAKILRLANLELDLPARIARRAGNELELTRIEFDLLAYLVANQNEVCSTRELYKAVWEYDFGPQSKNLAVYIGYLRRKTEEHGGGRLIHTVRSVGYKASCA